MEEERDFDILVYGANGFTAKWVIIDLFKEPNITFALCGRNQSKIQDTIKWIHHETGIEDVYNIPVVIASADELSTVARRARILLNCAGPNITDGLGESIVKACLESKTHYLDITGETYFMEMCVRNYGQIAEDNRVFVLNACGFDAVVVDAGVSFFKETLGKDYSPLWCESIVEFKNTFINHTTLETIILVLLNMFKLRKLRKSDPPSKPLNSYNYRLKLLPFRSEHTKQWTALYIGADPMTVRRSQRILAAKKLEEPIQYGSYICLGSFLNLVLGVFVGLFFVATIYFEKSRIFFIKNIDNFTLGRVRANGPTGSQIQNSHFSTLVYGEGRKDNDTKQLLVEVSGPDPGYRTTPICLVGCAITLLNDLKRAPQDRRMKFSGGVLTPASAFFGTDWLDQLSSRGLNMDVVSPSDYDL